ncbi:MAG TPA: ABC transporter permease subunit, partial [Planctomycetaceae bacterium]|nr:ABC transporter permease subunit [Planctomycetaceae bacterium]
MSAAHHLAVWGRLTLKELRETLRDRRTIATLVLMPILVYPLLGMAFSKFLFAQLDQQPAAEYHIAVEDEHALELFTASYSSGNQLLGKEIDPGRPLPPRAGEAPEPRLTLIRRNEVDDSPTLEELVESLVADIAVRFERERLPANVEFIVRQGSPLGREVREHVEKRFRAVNDAFVTQYFAAQRPAVKLPVTWSEVTVPGVAVQSFSLATLVPLVLILMTVTGAVYPAIDLTAGERERGTLEALMAAPISRTRVLLAKYAA